MISRPNCKLCTSPHRQDAEARYEATRNQQAVQRWLADLGEHISYTAVKNHFARHYLSPERAAREEEPDPGAPLDFNVVAVIDEVHALTLRQVRRLAAVNVDERNIGPISAALFRGLDLMMRQADSKARMLGLYREADEATMLQVQHLEQVLQRVLQRVSPELRQELTQELDALASPVREDGDA